MQKHFEQTLPIAISILVFFIGWALLTGELVGLNSFSVHDIISIHPRWSDVLVGLTIYLKTSVDFALFIASLMRRYPGWQNRVRIEVGTAAGNILGTLIIIALWSIFRELSFLLGLMVLVASLILLRMAEESLEHLDESVHSWMKRIASPFLLVIKPVNKLVHPLLHRLTPKLNTNDSAATPWQLISLSFGVPFILGLDDFAGYLPLFSVVRVSGFALGVFAGHAILSATLFASPKRTVQVVSHPIIGLVGGIAFVGLGVWGIYEAIHHLVHF